MSNQLQKQAQRLSLAWTASCAALKLTVSAPAHAALLERLSNTLAQATAEISEANRRIENLETIANSLRLSLDRYKRASVLGDKIEAAVTVTDAEAQ